MCTWIMVREVEGGESKSSTNNMRRFIITCAAGAGVECWDHYHHHYHYHVIEEERRRVLWLLIRTSRQQAAGSRGVVRGKEMRVSVMRPGVTVSTWLTMLYLVVMLMLGEQSMVHGRVIHVDVSTENTVETCTGTSLATACPTIESGLLLAISNDTVLVEPGKFSYS